METKTKENLQEFIKNYEEALKINFDLYKGAEVVIYSAPEHTLPKESNKCQLIFGAVLEKVENGQVYLKPSTENGLVHIIEDKQETEARDTVGLVRIQSSDEVNEMVKKYVKTPYLKQQTTIPLIDISSCLVKKCVIEGREIVYKTKKYAEKRLNEEINS